MPPRFCVLPLCQTVRAASHAADIRPAHVARAIKLTCKTTKIITRIPNMDFILTWCRIYVGEGLLFHYYTAVKFCNQGGVMSEVSTRAGCG